MNLIDRADCNSDTAPMIAGEVTPTTFNATWTKDATFSRSPPFCRKFTKTVAAGTQAYVTLTDNVSTADLHGMLPSNTYKFFPYLYIPSASGILGSEILILIYDYTTSWAFSSQAAANLYDQWQLVTVSRAIRAAATGAYMRINAAAAASLNEYFYVDDVWFRNLLPNVVSASFGGKIAGASFAGKRAGASFAGKRAGIVFTGA